MFINFWYAAALADEVTADQPLKARMLGQTVVLFRDAEGAVHCVHNTCSHRGGALGDGKIKGDTVECPYHGWRFGGDGRCRRIPSLGPDATIPARARIDAYPTVERYGLVFVFLGDLPESERPPILDIAEYDDPSYRVTRQTMEWNIDFRRSIENSIDPAHNEFVHDTHGHAGDNDDYHVPPLTLEETEWGVGFRNKMFAPPPAEGRMREASGRTESTVIEAGTGHHGPHMVWTHIHPTPTMHIHQYLFETPIEPDRTRLFLVTLRNFIPTPDYDAKMIERNAYVAGQDRVVLEALEPKQSPDSQRFEVLTPSDQAMVRYREFLKSWEARGWRIDTDRVAADRGRIAYAIPSPARREQKAFALPAVPLIPGAEAAREAAE